MEARAIFFFRQYGDWILISILCNSLLFYYLGVKFLGSHALNSIAKRLVTLFLWQLNVSYIVPRKERNALRIGLSFSCSLAQDPIKWFVASGLATFKMAKMLDPAHFLQNIWFQQDY